MRSCSPGRGGRGCGGRRGRGEGREEGREGRGQGREERGGPGEGEAGEGGKAGEGQRRGKEVRRYVYVGSDIIYVRTKYAPVVSYMY